MRLLVCALAVLLAQAQAAAAERVVTDSAGRTITPWSIISTAPCPAALAPAAARASSGTVNVFK